MFDPTNPKAILDAKDVDLARLPIAEDDRHEFKGSMTPDNHLKDKLSKAASGFWNSGGGLFVAGVGNDGKPDGGIAPTVGTQSRRDWIDNVLRSVIPAGRYYVGEVTNRGGCSAISAGNAVYLIAFDTSEAGPHMAPDNRYYIRAGAHTSPAPNFIVESIWARRHFQRPRVMHVASYDNFTSVQNWLNVAIIAVTDAPALDVEVFVAPNAGPRPEWTLPLRTAVVDRLHPFEFRFLFSVTATGAELAVKYKDVADRNYEYSATIDTRRCLHPDQRQHTELSRIARALEALNRQQASAALM